jgi:AcrR family transcriptional regulator
VRLGANRIAAVFIGRYNEPAIPKTVLGEGMRKSRASVRRMGVAGSEIRVQLIEEAVKLIRKEGWQAVTARRLAEKLGLKRQIVHYYFSTIEDLLIAVIRHDSEAIRARFLADLQAGEPLRVIWDLGNKVPATIFEFTALALRSKAIQTEIRQSMIEFRKIEIAAIQRYFELKGITPKIPPAAMAILLTGISHTLTIERALGVVEGHVQLKELIESLLSAYTVSGRLPA